MEVVDSLKRAAERQEGYIIKLLFSVLKSQFSLSSESMKEHYCTKQFLDLCEPEQKKSVQNRAFICFLTVQLILHSLFWRDNRKRRELSL